MKVAIQIFVAMLVIAQLACSGSDLATSEVAGPDTRPKSARLPDGSDGYRTLLDPNSPRFAEIMEAYRLRSQAKERSKEGRLQEARELLEQSWAILKSPDTAHRLAQVCVQLGDKAAAIEYYGIVLELESTLKNDPLVIESYAALVEAESPQEAQAIRERVVSSGPVPRSVGPAHPSIPAEMPPRAEVHAKVGFMASKRGDFEVAVREFDKLAEYVPNNAAVTYYRASFAASAGQIEKARELFERIRSSQEIEEKFRYNLDMRIAMLERD